MKGNDICFSDTDVRLRFHPPVRDEPKNSKSRFFSALSLAVLAVETTALLRAEEIARTPQRVGQHISPLVHGANHSAAIESLREKLSSSKPAERTAAVETIRAMQAAQIAEFEAEIEQKSEVPPRRERVIQQIQQTAPRGSRELLIARINLATDLQIEKANWEKLPQAQRSAAYQKWAETITSRLRTARVKEEALRKKFDATQRHALKQTALEKLPPEIREQLRIQRNFADRMIEIQENREILNPTESARRLRALMEKRLGGRETEVQQIKP